MKFIFALFAIVVAVFVQQINVAYATSEPVCSFVNAEGDTKFLKYYGYSKEGEKYVDFGTDGICLRQATCTDTYHTVVEECKSFPVTCDNKKTFTGVFPGCCVKC